MGLNPAEASSRRTEIQEFVAQKSSLKKYSNSLYCVLEHKNTYLAALGR